MKKCTAIIIRHGEYEKQKFGDGPLTTIGRRQIKETADNIAREKFLTKQSVYHGVALALVSGSFRGMDTFIELSAVFADLEIDIGSRIVDTAFFNTQPEDLEYPKLYGPNSEQYYPGFKADMKETGAHNALLKHAPHLIKNPAKRVVEAIRKAQSTGNTIFLIITHQGYEQVIVRELTGQESDVLEMGKHMVVEFD